MKISVAIINLNDGINLYRALKSAEFADEIIVVDGGSSDSTPIIIGKASDEMPGKIRYFQHPWQNHFAQQRNISFEQCTGDWIVRLDSDEMFGAFLRGSIREFLGELPEACLSVRVRQNNLVQDEDHYAANLGGWETHPRIFRNNGPLNWVGQVHEWVENVHHFCADWNVSVIHYGWLDTEKLKKKEQLYMQLPGSGFEMEGSLTGRHYEVRELPKGIK